IQAWQEAGQPLDTSAPALASPARSFLPRPRDELIARRQELPGLVAAGGVLLDVRTAARFRGAEEPIDPRAGHIPGAKNAPFTENLRSAAGPWRSPRELAHRYAALGAEQSGQVVCYCGSGITACHGLLALEVAGIPGGRLYAGSWSEWCSDP